MVENLRKLRLANGVTQQKLAEAIGVTQQSINKYENHSVEPDIGTLIRLADYFHTSVDYLIGRDTQQDAEAASAPMLSYRRLSEKEKASIRMVMQNYLKARK